MPVLSKKGIIERFLVRFALCGLLWSGRASMLPLGTLSLGPWVIAVDLAFIEGHQSIKNWIDNSTISLLSWQRLSFWSFLSTLGTKFAQIFRIFSTLWIIVCTVPTLTSNNALIVSIDTRRSLSTKYFIWPINSAALNSLLLHHLSSFLTDSLPSLNHSCHSNTDARFMQDGWKAFWSILYVFVAFFFLLLKKNFIAYRSTQVFSRPDFIFEIHQLWKSWLSRVYSNSCCSCSIEPEIIRICQWSH